MKRFSILAKIRDGGYFFLNFDDERLLDCLKQVPPPEGLLVLAHWPVNKPAEIEFFVELINGNIAYYHVKDFRTNQKRTVFFDKTELDH